MTPPFGCLSEGTVAAVYQSIYIKFYIHWKVKGFLHEELIIERDFCENENASFYTDIFA